MSNVQPSRANTNRRGHRFAAFAFLTAIIVFLSEAQGQDGLDKFPTETEDIPTGQALDDLVRQLAELKPYFDTANTAAKAKLDYLNSLRDTTQRQLDIELLTKQIAEVKKQTLEIEKPSSHIIIDAAYYGAGAATCAATGYFKRACHYDKTPAQGSQPERYVRSNKAVCEVVASGVCGAGYDPAPNSDDEFLTLSYRCSNSSEVKEIVLEKGETSVVICD